LGLREQQKAARRQKILVAAALLFARKGFEKTTVEEIATEAGLAWATVYKYFKTKGELLWAVVHPELERLFEEGGRVIADPPEQPVDAVIALLMCYTQWRAGWRDRDFLRAISMSGMTPAGVGHELATWANDMLQTQIAALLRVLQRRNQIPGGTNVADMATIIFDVFDREYLAYIHGNLPADQVIGRIVRLMKTLLEPWNAYARAARKSGSRKKSKRS
jgi:AcrR family transcriptional regulator